MINMINMIDISPGFATFEKILINMINIINISAIEDGFAQKGLETWKTSTFSQELQMGKRRGLLKKNIVMSAKTLRPKLVARKREVFPSFRVKMPKHGSHFQASAKKTKNNKYIYICAGELYIYTTRDMYR